MDYFLIYLIIYGQELSGKEIKKKKKTNQSLLGISWHVQTCKHIQFHIDGLMENLICTFRENNMKTSSKQVISRTTRACGKLIIFGNIRDIETNFARGVSAVKSEQWIDTKQCRMYADLSQCLRRLNGVCFLEANVTAKLWLRL